MDSRPWSAIPAQRSSKDKLKRRRRIVWAVLIVILFSGPAACAISSSAMTKAKEAATVNADLSRSAAAAQTVAWSFLSGSGSPIATVTGVDPKLGAGDKPIPFGKVDSLSYAGTTTVTSPDKNSADTSWQVSHFWVQSAGITYDLSITTTAGDGGPVLAATPALARVVTAPGSAQAPTFLSMAGSIPATKYSGLQSRVDIWAKAYGAGDINRLGEISENGPTYTIALGTAPTSTDAGVTYEVTTSKIVSMLGRKDGTVIAQVAVTYTNPANGFVMENNYDLLVDIKGEDGGLSVIREWGPTGQFNAAGTS